MGAAHWFPNILDAFVFQFVAFLHCGSCFDVALGVFMLLAQFLALVGHWFGWCEFLDARVSCAVLGIGLALGGYVLRCSCFLSISRHWVHIRLLFNYFGFADVRVY